MASVFWDRVDTYLINEIKEKIRIKRKRKFCFIQTIHQFTHRVCDIQIQWNEAGIASAHTVSAALNTRELFFGHEKLHWRDRGYEWRPFLAAR